MITSRFTTTSSKFTATFSDEDVHRLKTQYGKVSIAQETGVFPPAEDYKQDIVLTVTLKGAFPASIKCNFDFRNPFDIESITAEYAFDRMIVELKQLGDEGK